MFGVDFSELIVILLVTLVVVGPERLPKVARTLGHLWGRAQRYVHNVKTDIARDMAAEEFRQMQAKLQQEADNMQQAVQQAAQEVDQQVQQINRTVEQSLQPAPEATTANKPAQTEPPPASPQQKLPLDR